MPKLLPASFLLVFLLALPTQAADPLPPPQIAVVGEAERKFEPDYVEVSVLIRTVAQEMPEAQRRNDAAAKALKAAFQDLHISKDQVFLSNAQFGQDWDWNEGRRRFRGYWAQRSLRVELRDLSVLAPLLPKLAGVDGAEVQGVTYRVDDLEKKQMEVRLLALKDALAKAKAMAEVVDMSVVQALSVRERGVMDPMMKRSFAVSRGADEASGEPPPSFELDRVVVSESIDVVFETTADR